MNFTGMPPGMTPEMLAEMLGIGGQTTAQSAPRPDTNYSSGFDYARSIAGGIPASQMIAPGVSYSPDQPGGYTQQDLNAPSLPELPMQPLPQPIIEEPITGPIEPGFDGGYDFSNLPGYENPDSGYNFGGFNPGGLPDFNFLGNMPFQGTNFSQIQPNINFSMPNIDQTIGEQKGGLFGGIGRGITGLQGMQKDFKGFKEDMKDKAANKVRGLFGI